MKHTVHSFYQSNIAPEMLKAQADVFDHFEIPLNQWQNDNTTHGEWVTHVMREAQPGEVVMIADIDAFPTTYGGYENMVNFAKEGSVTGLAQVANHIDKDKIYAGPMFMAIQQDLYARFGSPNLQRNKQVDVAQILTEKAVAMNTGLHLVYPKFAIKPKWGLGNKGVFGVGTFYGDDEFFHLFEARRRDSIDLFVEVSKGVVSGKHDYDRYLDILGQKQEKKKFLGVF